MKAGSPHRAVFFDRDGTLMEEVHYCSDPALVRVFAGAAECLRTLRAAGFLSVIVTNQSGIASGKITIDQYHAVQEEVARQLDGLVDAVYFCADSPAAPTVRRKPGAGMIHEAVRDLGIDPGRSWMVGDKDIDIACGRAAGCRTILVRTGYGERHGGAEPDHVVDTVAGVAAIICGSDQVCGPGLRNR